MFDILLEYIKVCQTLQACLISKNFAKLGSGSYGTLEKKKLYIFISWRKVVSFVWTFFSQGHCVLEAQPEDQLEQTATTAQEMQPQGNLPC